MSQQQRLIPLILEDGTKHEAVATGNNASWLCKCKRYLPLLGKAGQVNGHSDKTKVTCPDCSSSYFVKPDGGDYKRAIEVVEL